MKKYYREIIIIGLLLLAVTAIFNFTDLDISIEKHFYDQSTGWVQAKEVPWKQIFDFTSIPALLLAVYALVGIILGYNFKRFAPYRKIFLYLVTLMIVAPGLIVNTVLKENFGRPRPRSITEFGGKYQYEAPLAYDSSSPGNSFPSGHASMGFYFLGVYVLFRKRKKFIAGAGLAIGILWGGLVGYTRMLQGGHFLSDVIWSAAIVYISAIILFHLFKFSPDLKIKIKELPKGKARVMTVGFSVLFCLIIIGALLATPRDKKHRLLIEAKDYAQADTLLLNLQFYKGQIQIIPSDKLYFQWYFQGFGFPKSNINYKLDTEWSGSTYVVDFSQDMRGFFTEMQQEILVYIPEDKNIDLHYTLGNEEVSQKYEQKNTSVPRGREGTEAAGN
ncbi:MAG: phosphatase PAP2 family protein [Candidatus Stygibacter frigidus]|nr:phosphatase PAP2 family protein [Candidatus Stygibacter frigidus]